MTKTLTAFALVIFSAQLCSATMVIRRFAPAGPPPPDLSAKFVAWWDMEEASSATRANNTSALCGTACDLSNNGSVTKDATNFITGSASADFSGNGSHDYLSCTDATCGGTGSTRLDVSGTDLTWFCWLRGPTTFSNTEHKRIFDKRSTNGYEIQYRNTGDGTFRCRTNTNGNTDAASNATPHDTTWQHAACVYDDASGNLQPVANGVNSGTLDTSATISDATVNFTISENAQEWEGQLDECGVIKQKLTAAQICHIMSCGIDGPNGPCTCNGSAYSDDGRHTTMSLGCSLSGIACDNPIP